MAALVQEFNNFGGDSIQEHSKRFCLYVKKLSVLDDTERLHVLNHLRAEYRQEELYLTKLLLKFRQVEKLKQLMLQGDRVLNKVITNHKPFIFKDESVQFFLQELFPNVSYIVRNKCLLNLCKTIKRDYVGEELFKQVLERYGIKTAQILLPVCNEAFIRDILSKYRVILRERQLVTLHQRFGVNFLTFYYAECSLYGLNDHFGDQPHFAKYLAIADIATFCQLLKFGTPKIGKRGFKKFLSIKKEEFINEPQKYSILEKPRIVNRMLTKQEFQVYFLNMLPKNIHEFSAYSMQTQTSRIRIKERGSVLAKVFKDKYGVDLYTAFSNKPDGNCSLDRLPLLSAEDMLKFNLNEEEKLEYLPPGQSFALIKERINLTSDMNTRCELILKLFKSAKNYDDQAALVEALKYLIKRHKNDNSTIREDVFSYLNDNYKIQKLSAEIWEQLHEMILAEQMLRDDGYLMRDMMVAELEYKFSNGMDFSEMFKRVAKEIGYNYLSIPTKIKELKRWILLHFPDYCKEHFTSEEEMKVWPKAFLEQISLWNKENARDKISYYDYPDLIQLTLKHYENQQTYYYFEAFPLNVLRFNTDKPEDIKMQDEIIKKHLGTSGCTELKFWCWLLKHRVDVLVKHIDIFFEKCYDVYHVKEFLYELSKMHYTPLPALVRAKSLHILKECLKAIDTGDTKKINSTPRHICLWALSYEKDFFQIIEKDSSRYYPSGETEAEVNVLDESFKETLKLREQVVEILRTRPCSQEVMPVLLRFCYKDYFRYALPVLTVVLYNLPERYLVEAFAILQDRSVSVRKRALFFSTTLGNAKISCDSLQHAAEHEKNVSLQKFVFNRTFKNFCFVGSQRSWQLLMDNFKFVFEKDKETQEMVFQFQKIPRVYLPLYIEKVWNCIGKKWENQHNKVLNALNAETMKLLSDELCDDIIHFSLVHSKDQLVSSDVDFIYSYLLSAGDKIDHRFNIVSNNARVIADEDSQLDFKEFNKKSHNICFLYKDICRRFLAKEEGETTHLAEKKMLVNKLTEAFPNLPLPYNHLDYQLQINVCRCFLHDADKLPELFIKLQKDVLERHGDFMLDYFTEFASSQIDLLSFEVEYKMSFVQKMLEKDDSMSVKLLAIGLMPGEYPSSEVLATQFRNLIEKIEADSPPVVSLYLNRYLKNLSV